MAMHDGVTTDLRDGRAEEDDIPLRRRAPHEPVPLVAVQWRFLTRVLPAIGLSGRMSATALRIFGDLDAGLLREAVAALTQRHEALRTRIVPFEADWRQEISSTSIPDFTATDLTRIINGTTVHDEVTRLARTFLDEKVNLAVDPLFSIRLFGLSDHEHVLTIAIDHIISDAVSCDIINKELWALYDQAATGGLPALPALHLQLGDYAVWQQQTYASWLRTHQGYWTRRLHEARYVGIPTDKSATDTQIAGSVLHLPLGKKLSVELEALTQREGIRLPLAMLMVYSIAMSHWCASQDLVIEIYMHGRHRPGLENIVGFFAYPLHLVMSVRPMDTFLELLHRAGAEFATAREHEDYGRLVYFLPNCNSTDLSFNWLRSSESASTQVQRPSGHSLKFHPFPVRSVWPVKFAAFFSHTRAGIGATVHYRSDLFHRQTIERFGRNLRRIAQQFVQHPDSCLSSVAIE